MKEISFLYCRHCGNIVAFVKKKGPTPLCCGETMALLEAGASDGSKEKHLPVIDRLENGELRVSVGSAEHPMSGEHFIEWVCLETKRGRQRKTLKPGDRPELRFALCGDDEPVAAYAYCNLHGLWKATV